VDAFAVGRSSRPTRRGRSNAGRTVRSHRRHSFASSAAQYTRAPREAHASQGSRIVATLSDGERVLLQCFWPLLWDMYPYVCARVDPIMANAALQYDLAFRTLAGKHLDVYVDGDDADRDAGDACGDVFPSVRPRTASSASRASARAYSSMTSGRSPYGVTLRAKKDRRQSSRERDKTRPASSIVFFSLADAFSGARCVPTRWIRSLGALRVSRRRRELFRSNSSPAVASPEKRETRTKSK